jgi:hypothetical protein
MAGAATERLVRDQKRRYLAYLLRLWQVRDKGQMGWRASTENVSTGEQRGFAGLADLFNFLENESGQAVQDQHAPNMGEKGGEAEKQQPDQKA